MNKRKTTDNDRRLAWRERRFVVREIREIRPLKLQPRRLKTLPLSGHDYLDNRKPVRLIRFRVLPA